MVSTETRDGRYLPAHELYRQIVESAEDMAIISMDLDRRITSWNVGAERLLGYETSEIVARTADVIFTPEDRDQGVPAGECRLALRKGRAEDERWHMRKDGTRFWGSGLMMPLKNESDDAVGFVKMFRDRTRQHEREKDNELLQRELDHRVKNTIAMVHALAFQLVRTTSSLKTFEQAFTDRLQALSRAHDLLKARQWQGASLHDVASRTLNVHASADGRIDLDGEPIILRSSSAIALHLIFYELATNASKYGALSSATGRITIRWRIEQTREGPAAVIEWIESDGPVVKPALAHGFGSRLIEQSVAQMSGEAAIAYDPRGLRCTIRLPMDKNALLTER